MGLTPKGRPLATQLLRRMNLNGVTVTAMAKQLGISQSYLSELLVGDKEFSTVRDDLVRAIAAYLGVPVVVCMVLAGRLQHRDFVAPAVDVDARRRAALAEVATSAMAMETAVDIQLLSDIPVPVQYLVVLLFERATGRSLMLGEQWSWSSINSAMP